ncbi:MAG: serine/threonine protein phosphatase [Myxococcales bacterium]|nr:serine/threonine protein phosphatase [Myxococcales bacterium]
MARTVIVGDVHGCARELEDLLSYVGLSSSDKLFFVGDLVVRGPRPREVIALAREHGAVAVRGNHEDRLLRWKRSKGTDHEIRIGAVTRRAAEALKPRDWEYLEELPLWADLPSHETRIVHAGLMPGIPIEEQDPRTLMNIRTLDRHHEPSELRGSISWAHHYAGPQHIVFGHNASVSPDIALHATGIDTGAVYGGRLTAMVLREGERPPPPEDRAKVLVSVPSRRVYFEKDRPSHSASFKLLRSAEGRHKHGSVPPASIRSRARAGRRSESG